MPSPSACDLTSSLSYNFFQYLSHINKEQTFLFLWFNAHLLQILIIIEWSLKFTQKTVFVGNSVPVTNLWNSQSWKIEDWHVLVIIHHQNTTKSNFPSILIFWSIISLFYVCIISGVLNNFYFILEAFC